MINFNDLIEKMKFEILPVIEKVRGVIKIGDIREIANKLDNLAVRHHSSILKNTVWIRPKRLTAIIYMAYTAHCLNLQIYCILLKRRLSIIPGNKRSFFILYLTEAKLCNV